MLSRFTLATLALYDIIGFPLENEDTCHCAWAIDFQPEPVNKWEYLHQMQNLLLALLMPSHFNSSIHLPFPPTHSHPPPFISRWPLFIYEETVYIQISYLQGHLS